MKRLVLLTLAIMMIAGLALGEAAPIDEAAAALEAYRSGLFGEVVPDDYSLALSEELFGYSTRIDAIEATVDEAVAARSASRDLLRSIDRDCDAIDHELEICEDAVEASYRAKTVDHDMFKLLDDAIERLDDRLDRIEDMLEDYFDYDD